MLNFLSSFKNSIFLTFLLFSLSMTAMRTSETQIKIEDFNPKKDKESVVRIFKENWNYFSELPFEEEAAEDIIELSSNKMIKILHEGLYIVGVIKYELFSTIGTIELLAVDKSVRKKGYGKQLIESAINNLQKKGAKELQVYVYENNFSAIKLYKQLGFKESGREGNQLKFTKSVAK